jgi:hypothetical protein
VHGNAITQMRFVRKVRSRASKSEGALLAVSDSRRRSRLAEAATSCTLDNPLLTFALILENQDMAAPTRGQPTSCLPEDGEKPLHTPIQAFATLEQFKVEFRFYERSQLVTITRGFSKKPLRSLVCCKLHQMSQACSLLTNGGLS